MWATHALETCGIYISVRPYPCNTRVPVTFAYRMKNTFLLLLCMALSVQVVAQQKESANTMLQDLAVGTFLVRVSYVAQIPAGDYSKRFGFTNQIGGSLAYKTKSNWLFALGGHYIFGNNVVGKDSLLSELLNSNNIIIGKGGEQAYVDISQQGYALHFSVGKIFPWLAPNRNSGFMFSLGGGFMEHWISYKSAGNEVPQLLGDYHKGYDRLTNGIYLNQFIGYHYQGTSRLLNFYGGLEFTQSFTGNRRSYDIPTMSVIDENYTDLLFGFKIGWMMPFYKRNQNEYYEY